MQTKKIIIIACFFLSIGLISPVYAAYPVFDSANFGRQIMNYMQALKRYYEQNKQTVQNQWQIYNQEYQIMQNWKAIEEQYETNKKLYDQIMNQKRQLENMAKNLQRLQAIFNDPNMNLVEKVQSAIRLAKSIGYSMKNIEYAYDEIYRLTGKKFGVRELNQKRDVWYSRTYESLSNAVKIQASIEQIESDKKDLAEAIQKSRSAAGNLEALQAQNEILANLTKQLMRLEQITATSNRANAVRMSEQAALQEAMRKHHSYMMKDFTKKSSVTPLNDLP